jgi:tryptophan-rich sensory protein
MKAVASLIALLLPAAYHAFTSPLPRSAAVASSRLGGDHWHQCRRSNNNIESTPSSLSASPINRDPYASPQLDTAAMAKYLIASITELSLFALAFASLDRLTSIFLHTPPSSLPIPLLSLLFYAIALKSRILNPLNNARPNRDRARSNEASNGFRDRIMPSWTPPGVVFPIMWLLIIGPIRAYSSSLIVHSTDRFLSLPLMSFILHLTMGDVWNTINNTEKRYGASVIGVLLVLASAIHASFRYFTVLPLAGKLLGVTCIWLSVATALITDTWRLNPITTLGKDGQTKRRVPLFPVAGEAETTFLWFNNKNDVAETCGDDSGPGCIRKVDYELEQEKITYRNRAHLFKSKGITE